MIEDKVILVNEHDVQIGLMSKTEAHEKALLHRAISVFICNTNGQWLLHRRAATKYHSSCLWTNTCCSHPLPGETNTNAANRRLMEEMGLECNISEIFSFTYKEAINNQLTEHEFDHVFIGITNNLPNINKHEVMEYKYMKFSDIEVDMLTNPKSYTVWFKKIFKRVNNYFIEKAK